MARDLASVVAGQGRGRDRGALHPWRALPVAAFRDAQDPRAYVEWTFAEQDEAEVWFGEPIVSGELAMCEYWGVVTFQGRAETIAGVSLIRFDGDGLVTDQRDYWNAYDGRRRPPEGWRS